MTTRHIALHIRLKFARARLARVQGYLAKVLSTLGLGRGVSGTPSMAPKALGTSPPLTEVSRGPKCRKSLENVWPQDQKVSKSLGDSPGSLRRVSEKCLESVFGVFRETSVRGGLVPNQSAIPDEATTPDFPLFLFFLALTVRLFRISVFSAAFCCPVFCCMPNVDPHVPHILWIESEENWDDWLCQGWVWVETHTQRDKQGSISPCPSDFLLFTIEKPETKERFCPEWGRSSSQCNKSYLSKESTIQDVGKGGLSLRGGSLHDGFGGFDGFGGSGEHLTLLLLVLQNTA